MTVRERMEQEEYDVLSPQAQKAAETKGRPSPEEDNDVRTCYQRDADRILHSKSFRRLMHKTQVFLSPEGDHYRTRMTHTLEVARIARTICRGLRLNQDLAEAAAYGHDLGHTPFGHAGEKALSSMMEKPFRHNEQSLRVVDTLEGQIVRTSDRIAYINHDIDDAMRAGILTEDDIPPEIAEILGHSHSQRINTLVENMIDNTIATGTLGMQPEIAQAMDRLRTFMFARVYTNPVAKGEETKAKDMLCRLFEYYMRRPEKLPADFLPQLDFDGMERIVCDYIAGMTDRYAVYKYSELFIPTTWQVR